MENGMKTSSAKAKGRNLQKKVRELLIEHLGIECKNQEALNIWAAYKQAEENCKGYEPLAVIKRNHHKPLAVVDLEAFILLNRKDEV